MASTTFITHKHFFHAGDVSLSPSLGVHNFWFGSMLSLFPACVGLLQAAQHCMGNCQVTALHIQAHLSHNLLAGPSQCNTMLYKDKVPQK
jgi:hypothetical protein